MRDKMEGKKEEGEEMREERRGSGLGSGAMGLSQMQDGTIWTKVEPGL